LRALGKRCAGFTTAERPGKARQAAGREPLAKLE
jgi:hypothetical protein